MSDGKISRFVRGSVVVFVGLALGFGSEFGTRIVLARHLAVGDYGTIVFGSTVLGFVGTVSVFGLPVGLSREIPREKTPADLFTGSLVTNVSLGVVISVVLLTLSDPLFTLLGVTGSLTLLRLFIAALPFFVFVELAIGGFRGEEDAVGRVLIKSISLRFVRLGCITVAITLGFGTFWIGVVWLTPVVVAAVLAALLLYERTELLSLSAVRQRRFEPIKNLYLFSFPVMVAFVMNSLVQQVDTLVVGVFWAAEGVGTYDTAFTLGRMFILFSVGFGFLFLPRFSDMDAQSDRSGMVEFYGQVTKWMTHLAVPVLLVVIAFSREIIVVVFRESYAAAALAFVIISVGFFLNTLMGPNVLALIAVGRQRTVLAGSSLAFVVNVGLNVGLVPAFGIEGAALATLAAFVCLNGFWGFFLYRAVGAKPFVRPVVIPAVGTALMFLPMVKLSSLSNGIDSFGSLAGFTVLASVLHLCSIFALGGFQQSDLDWLTSLTSWLPVTEATVERVFLRYIIRT